MLYSSSHIHCFGHHDALAIPHCLLAHLRAGYCGQHWSNSSSLVCLLRHTQQVKYDAILAARGVSAQSAGCVHSRCAGHYNHGEL